MEEIIPTIITTFRGMPSRGIIPPRGDTIHQVLISKFKAFVVCGPLLFSKTLWSAGEQWQLIDYATTNITDMDAREDVYLFSDGTSIFFEGKVFAQGKLVSSAFEESNVATLLALTPQTFLHVFHKQVLLPDDTLISDQEEYPPGVAENTYALLNNAGTVYFFEDGNVVTQSWKTPLPSTSTEYVTIVDCTKEESWFSPRSEYMLQLEKGKYTVYNIQYNSPGFEAWCLEDPPRLTRCVKAYQNYCSRTDEDPRCVVGRDCSNGQRTCGISLICSDSGVCQPRQGVKTKPIFNTEALLTFFYIFFVFVLASFIVAVLVIRFRRQRR
jgi:hypothetical protein